MSESSQERQWIWDLRRGRREALTAMYDCYKHDMLALGMSLARDRDIAEDAVHDVFVNLARKGPELRIRGRLKPYLLASVSNRVRNLGRRPSFSPLSEIEAEDSAAEDPARGLVSDERTSAIDRALRQLPEDQRDVILLHLQHELPFREVSDLLSISINTAKSRYRYGMDKLRRLLNGTGL